MNLKRRNYYYYNYCYYFIVIHWLMGEYVSRRLAYLEVWERDGRKTLRGILMEIICEKGTG
jgi:hypothetical protein